MTRRLVFKGDESRHIGIVFEGVAVCLSSNGERSRYGLISAQWLLRPALLTRVWKNDVTVREPRLNARETLKFKRTVKRFQILNGDKTTANGIVQAVPTSIQLSDKDVAHEGDPVACLACNTTGKVQCDGPRQIMTAPDGRHAALSDDLCICGCHPPPRLVASQQMMSTEA